MSQNLRDYTKTLYAVDGVVRRLDDSDWDKPSPNDDWTAKETLGHVIFGIRRIIAAITDDDPPSPQAEADVAGQKPAETWQEAMDNVLAALDQRGILDKEVDSPFGKMTIDKMIGTFLMDPLTHAWDIAKAAGIDAAIPEELAEKAIAILDAMGDAIRGPGVMNNPVEVHDAPVVDQFIANTGRQP